MSKCKKASSSKQCSFIWLLTTVKLLSSSILTIIPFTVLELYPLENVQNVKNKSKKIWNTNIHCFDDDAFLHLLMSYIPLENVKTKIVFIWHKPCSYMLRTKPFIYNQNTWNKTIISISIEFFYYLKLGSYLKVPQCVSLSFLKTDKMNGLVLT
jgi:hypothetical protein